VMNPGRLQPARDAFEEWSRIGNTAKPDVEADVPALPSRKTSA